MKCAALIRGRACCSPITWKGTCSANVYYFCTRHVKRAKRLKFWEGTKFEKLTPAAVIEPGELRKTREILRVLVLAVEAKSLHKAFGIFDCPMEDARKLLGSQFLYGSDRDRS
jgi:hypothetical protein